jgi:hypothetical protein
VIALIAALVLAGLLLLERSGPSPVRNLRNISTGQAAQASATGAAGQSHVLAPRSALPTRLNDASISAAGKSQITDVMGNATATCFQFVAGTATTRSTVSYDTKDTTISKVTVPGAFFYWLSVSTSAGPQTFTVTQSTTYAPMTGTPLFHLTSEGRAFDTSCNMLATTETGGDDSVTVSFTAPTAGTYVFAVEYMTHSIIGSSPASSTPGFSYPYTFSTSGVSGSTQGLMLTHV